MFRARKSVRALLLGLSLGAAGADPPARQPVPPEEAASYPRTVPDDGLPATAVPRALVPIPAPSRPPALAAPSPPARPPVTIDLAGALNLVNASNPTIALARERVNEAYARQQQAAVLWIPNAFIGSNPDAPAFLPMFYHHDGQIQNAEGNVFNTVKSNFALENGVSLNLSITDAIFAPRVARQATAAAAARSRMATDDVQLDVALTYLDLLRAFGALAINAETIRMGEEMLRAAESAEKSGFGKTTADASRARTEVDNRKRERIDLEGQAVVVSARLAQLLVLDPTLDLVPGDRAVVPVALVNTDVGLDELIATGLLNRPELAESRALVRQALVEWRANKLRPLIPTLQVLYYNASFQGGDPGFHNTGYRDDVMAQAGWQFRNGGFGDLYRAKESRARYNEANYHVLEVQAQVGAEVTAAAKLTLTRARTLNLAQDAVRQAEEMWARLSKASFGLGAGIRRYDPLEPLVAEQQLHEARIQYLDEVISYNRQQFRLYWAMGQPPLCALPTAAAISVQTPVIPVAGQPPGAADQPPPVPGRKP
jgi:outer membrane protein TolC